MLDPKIKLALRDGYYLMDFAILLLLGKKDKMSRAEMEAATGMNETAVRRSTIRLSERGVIQADKKHQVGGAKKREARYSLVLNK
jgi:predicted ArsR family transcriptional regulator